jgi:AcrR family transcriptional regulator
MPSRNETEFEQRRQQIMDGALRAFAEKGFERATNKDIANAAGIRSPGLIYHYFEDKGDLFRRMLERYLPVVQLLEKGDDFLEAPPREALTTFARAVARSLTNPAVVALVKVMLGESLRRPSVAEMVNAALPRRGFTFLSRYLAHQMDAGRLRRMDPSVAVRCFAGPLLIYVLSREVFPQSDSRTLDPDTMADAAVDVFLCGMAVGSEASADVVRRAGSTEE